MVKNKDEKNIHKAFSSGANLKERFSKTYGSFVLENKREIRYEAGEIICYNDIEVDTSENKSNDVIVKEYDVKYGGLVKDNLPADFIYGDSDLEVQFVS